ncbi:MAG: hypothetical protein ACE5J7_01705 [Candidatus Aenigmatarchaeota archaeon]
MIMPDWNVIVTTQRRDIREAFKQLRPHGEFKRSAFRGILTGKVENKEEFMDRMKEVKFPAFFRIIPIDAVFLFEPDKLTDRLKEMMPKYAEKIPEGESWDIAFERRGLKGAINSMEITNILREQVKNLTKGRLDFEKPENIIVIETLGKECGVGFLSKEMKEKYHFVRAD